jgi:hypothetical protein
MLSLDYLRIDKLKGRTDKSLCSNCNVLFAKILNYGLTLLMLRAVTPSELPWQIAHLHNCGCWAFCFASTVNCLVLYLLSPERPTTSFNPLLIISATLQSITIILADFVEIIQSPLNRGRYFFIWFSLVWTIYSTIPPCIPEFKTLFYLDIWAFFFYFFIRKVCWLMQNIREKDEIVRYFSTTCWDRVQKAPVLEFIYCATQGICTVMAIQLGKVCIVFGCSQLHARDASSEGTVGIVEAIYAAGFVLEVLQLLPTKFFGVEMLAHFNTWHYKTHKFMHQDPAQYVTKHFDHHDVLPLASIGSLDSGYQEGFLRGINPSSIYLNCRFNLLYAYAGESFQEWSHNYCPTAKNSEVISSKIMHLEHHMNRTLPFGFVHDYEVEQNGFKHDEAIWMKIKEFLPEIKLPEKSVDKRSMLKIFYSSSPSPLHSLISKKQV